MYGFGASTGRLLGSVALRYRHPIGVLGGMPVVPGRAGRFLRSAKPAEDVPSGQGPAARSDDLARLEAVLFLARQPQASRKLAELAGLADGTWARTLVRSLNRLYDAEGSAFRVEQLAGGYQLMSRPKFAPWLKRLHSSPTEVRLSAPAMETLAVVAYQQPVLRAGIEAIRGVQCGEVLRQLIERDLVRITGRSEELGRPFLYGTTRYFLQLFGLRRLDELPQISSHSHEAEEETIVKTLTTLQADQEVLVDCNTQTASQPERSEQPNDEYVSEDFDEDDDDYSDEDDLDLDEDDDDDDEQDEDEDFEDEPWEEVEEDEEEDEEDWEDEDWEEGDLDDEEEK